jgi:UDP-glucose 4-epimerase
MKVLVTGAGLVGAYAAAELVSRGHEVSLLDIDPDFAYSRTVIGVPLEEIVADLTNVNELRGALATREFDAIVHTAGMLRDKVIHNQHRAFEVNVSGSAAVGQIAIEKAVPRLLFLSSVAVYGPNVAGDHVCEGVGYAAESLYGHTKVLSEQWLTAICERAGVGLTILRSTGVYGAGQFRGGAWMGRQLQDYVAQAMNPAVNEVVIEEDTLGTNEYLYVKDLARAIALSLESKRTRSGVNVLNIGAGRIYTARQVHRVFQDTFRTATFQHQPASTELPVFLKLTTAVVIDRAKKVIGYSPHYGDLSDGVRDFVQESFRVHEVISKISPTSGVSECL